MTPSLCGKVGDGTRSNFWAIRYEPTTGWGLARLIAGSASDLRVAMDLGGNVIAVWRQSDGIWAVRYVMGDGWGQARLIGGSGWRPQVAMDAAGNGIAVWSQSDGIWANRYVARGGWGTAERIGIADANSAGHPQVAVNSTGDAVAVWQQSANGTTNIWANRYVAGAEWGTAQRIETHDPPPSGVGTRHALYPRVAIDPAGNAIAAWNLFSGGEPYDVFMNHYAPASGWGTAQPIDTPATWTGPQWNPEVAMDSAGNAIAVWQRFDPDN